MTQTSKPQTGENSLNVGWGVVLAVLGVLAIVEAARLGEPINAARVLYDIGLAMLTVALVELLLMRVFAILTSRKGELEKIAEHLSDLDAQSNARLAKWDREFDALKRAVFETTVERIETKIDGVDAKVDRVLSKLP